jgi:hypothetical protein
MLTFCKLNLLELCHRLPTLGTRESTIGSKIVRDIMAPFSLFRHLPENWFAPNSLKIYVKKALRDDLHSNCSFDLACLSLQFCLLIFFRESIPHIIFSFLMHWSLLSLKPVIRVSATPFHFIRFEEASSILQAWGIDFVQFSFVSAFFFWFSLLGIMLDDSKSRLQHQGLALSLLCWTHYVHFDHTCKQNSGV